ncbi:MAG: hypothetical protein KW793_01715 [Candidatus Doudnabacteria bacterium]|nr:hypothetical protein [Candidatus Doudnabacteria bacterium]
MGDQFERPVRRYRGRKSSRGVGRKVRLVSVINKLPAVRAASFDELLLAHHDVLSRLAPVQNDNLTDLADQSTRLELKNYGPLIH